MAALATDVAIEFDASAPPALAQIKGEADTYFRGGLAHHTAGILNVVPLATEAFAGVIWERKVAALNDLVWVAVTGRFHYANANFTDANYGVTFAMPAATLADNPADLVVAAVGTAGTVGTLDHVTSTAVSGWLNINRRSAAENL